MSEIATTRAWLFQALFYLPVITEIFIDENIACEVSCASPFSLPETNLDTGVTL
jgi:hypothetical protein